jgi:hypothetical protein
MIKKYQKRESGIELLKILSVFIIIISHITILLWKDRGYIELNDILNLQHSSTSINNIILCWFQMFGAIGNTIFFVCSSWFLIEDNKINLKKVINILLINSTINILILIFFLIVGAYNISVSDIIKSFFPNTFLMVLCQIVLVNNKFDK